RLAVPAAKAPNVEDPDDTLGEMDFDNGPERFKENHSFFLVARLALLVGIGLQLLFKRVGGGGNGLAKGRIGRNPDLGQIIQRRLNPFDGEHHSFSRWARTSAVV